MDAEARGTARDILAELAAQSATGRLVLQHPDRGHSWIWLRDGLLCSVSTAGEDGLLGALLIREGQLAAEQLANLLARAREAPVPSDLSAVAVTSGALSPEVVYRARCVVLGHALHRAVSRGVVATHFLGGDVFPTLTAPVNVADAFAAGAQQAPATATFTGSVPPSSASPAMPAASAASWPEPAAAPTAAPQPTAPANPAPVPTAGTAPPPPAPPPSSPTPAAAPQPVQQQVADLRDPRALMHDAGSRGVPPNDDLARLAETLDSAGGAPGPAEDDEDGTAGEQRKPRKKEKAPVSASEESSPKKSKKESAEPPKPREPLRYRPDHAAMRELQELGRILNEDD